MVIDEKRNVELYCISFPNKKKYIGLSVCANKRFASHKRNAFNGGKLPVHSAIRKYIDGVSCKVLCVGSAKYIAAMEILAIALYGTQDRKFGYNLSSGGESGFMGMRHSTESIEKMRKAALEYKTSTFIAGEKRPFSSRKPMSDATKLKISEYRKGKTHSKETKEKMSISINKRIAVSRLHTVL